MAQRTRSDSTPAQAGPTREAASKRPTFFLRTKLLPPRPASVLLSRPRLTERLQANLSHPVTLVTAPAGSGKTTLVADFVREHARQFVWYQLDHADADPLVFLEYLAHGIRQAVPGFGDVTLSYLSQSADEVARAPARAVDVLLNEVLREVSRQLVVVLDDYHHLGSDTAVHAVLDRLISYLPDVMHVIIVSRDVPPLALSRLRSQDSLAIIDRQELLFTDEETRELFRQVFDLELSPEQLAEYRERTQGWITALQLVRQFAQRDATPTASVGGGAADLREILRRSEHDIFDYFAEEVFADETEDVQRFLLRISLLERIELDACARLYPEVNSRHVLPELVRRNVFMTVASDSRGEEYRLHPLFRTFLQRRFGHESGREGAAAEHARCADFYLERGEWEHAARHLIASEDFGRAAAVVAERGGHWIAAGALASLTSLVEVLPTEDIRAHPRALFYRGEVARLREELDSARSLYRRAASLLREQNDREGEAETLRSLATVERRYGDLETALAYLDRAVELAAEDSAVSAKCAGTRGLCLMAKGDWAASEREFRAALQGAEDHGDEHYARLMSHNLGLPALIRGDFDESLRWLRRTLQYGVSAPPIPQEAGVHLNMARCHLYRGEFAECETHLNRSLELAQLFNLGVLQGEIFEAYGNLYRESREVARAVEFYARASRVYKEAGLELARRELPEEQAMLSAQEGDLTAARAALDRLVEARAAMQNEAALKSAVLARARVCLAQGEHEAARAELGPALTYFREHNLHYYEAQASIALASCAASAGSEKECLEHLRRAVELAVRYDYEYWLRREVEQSPSLFSHEQAQRLLPVDLRQRLSALRAQPPAARAPAAAARAVPASQPSSDLTINMLGPVEIYRDPSRPLSPDAWTSKRARDILCFIASRQHRRASKDTLIDTFWRDDDPESVEKKFHPTISYIRKALNSNQLLRQNLLLYKDGEYLLNPELSCRSDVEEFDRLVSEAASAHRRGETERCLQAYEEAVSLYRGEFMQGANDEWAEEQRSYYRDQYLRMLEKLAAAAQGAGEWERSLALAQKILRDDPFREEVHCRVMRAHAALGNRVAVKDQYETLRGLLREELGVEPAQETQRVYRESVK
ncbi:MAG TPA: BTAD domain-containing putative transcriptional regulator [Pyrinomonadaceae bacterium]|jgi:LuxR family maltose regulon positive regulatory protein|nr:BTAD domain-containing putative transcriptional regulator [Pyrinomonadaceae bacterium]